MENQHTQSEDNENVMLPKEAPPSKLTPKSNHKQFQLFAFNFLGAVLLLAGCCQITVKYILPHMTADEVCLCAFLLGNIITIVPSLMSMASSTSSITAFIGCAVILISFEYYIEEHKIELSETTKSFSAFLLTRIHASWRQSKLLGTISVIAMFCHLCEHYKIYLDVSSLSTYERSHLTTLYMSFYYLFQLTECFDKKITRPFDFAYKFIIPITHVYVLICVSSKSLGDYRTHDIDIYYRNLYVLGIMSGMSAICLFQTFPSLQWTTTILFVLYGLQKLIETEFEHWEIIATLTGILLIGIPILARNSPNLFSPLCKKKVSWQSLFEDIGLKEDTNKDKED